MATVLQPAEVRSFDKLLIGGRWVQPSSDRRIVSISPVTEEAITHVPEAQPADIDAAVAAARRAFDEGPWPRMTPAERAAALRRIRDEIEVRIPELANSFTAEIGTPITLSEGFLAGALTMYSAAADALERFSFEEDAPPSAGPGGSFASRSASSRPSCPGTRRSAMRRSSWPPHWRRIARSCSSPRPKGQPTR